MAAERVFLDSNILINAVIPESPRYFHARGVLQRLEREDAEVWVSRQVLREFLCVMSRPQAFGKPFPVGQTLATVQVYEQQFFVAEDQALVSQQLYLLLEKIACGGKQIHDANIVATMLAFDIPRIITDNIDDFKRFAGLITIDSQV